jgi:hypothetical protein
MQQRASKARERAQLIAFDDYPPLDGLPNSSRFCIASRAKSHRLRDQDLVYLSRPTAAERQDRVGLLEDGSSALVNFAGSTKLTLKLAFHCSLKRPRSTIGAPVMSVAPWSFEAHILCVGWRGRIRTFDLLIQSQAPYRLATRQWSGRDDTASPVPDPPRGSARTAPYVRGSGRGVVRAGIVGA